MTPARPRASRRRSSCSTRSSPRRARAGAAADTLIARYFKTRRYAGSKDRRAVRELVFRAIRRAGERAGLRAGGDARARPRRSGAARLVRRLAARPGAGRRGRSRRPSAAIAPAWLLERVRPADRRRRAAGAARARAARPAGQPAQGRRATRRWRCCPRPSRRRISPIGLRLPEGFRVEETDAWRAGLVEVQDEGSQLICLACEAAPGMMVVDLCAGAGGKTLALAAEMANEGRIVACRHRPRPALAHAAARSSAPA